MIGIFFFQLFRNKHLKERWYRVIEKPAGIITFIILCTYMTVTILDSMHFRKALPTTKNHSQTYYSNEVYSLMDVVLVGLKEQTEQTYSAPFSRTSFVQQTITDANEQLVRTYPALIYGGSHLTNNDSILFDVIIKLFQAILTGIGISLLICLPHVYYQRKKSTSIKLQTINSQKNIRAIPWRTAYTTITLIICFWTIVIHLGNSYHILGTDQAGNDTLYESIKGIRTGFLVGIFSTVFMLPIAVILGISAGYFRGFIDDIVQYLITLVSSIPFILLAAASALLFQTFIENYPGYFEVGLEKADAKFLALCLILAFTGWSGLCRMLRAETLKIKQLSYVKAAHAFGVSHQRIIFRHIMPNVMHLIMILFILDFSAMVMAEAVLSFIGVGVDPAMASWGNMVNMSRAEMARSPAIWWNLSSAFFFMFILVLSANLFSDLVNNAFGTPTSQASAQESS